MLLRRAVLGKATSSHLSFSIDLVEFMSRCYSGLSTLSESVKNVLSDDIIETYLKLYLLLYADDTVIFAESNSDLQLALNFMPEYCKFWKLTVILPKQKLLSSLGANVGIYSTFDLESDELERVDDSVILE